MSVTLFVFSCCFVLHMRMEVIKALGKRYKAVIRRYGDRFIVCLDVGFLDVI